MTVHHGTILNQYLLIKMILQEKQKIQGPCLLTFCSFLHIEIQTILYRPEDSERYLNEQKERFTPFISQLQINDRVTGKVRIIEDQDKVYLLFYQSLETSSSLLSPSKLPSPVSVISNPVINGSYSTSLPSNTSPRSKNSMKRSFAEDNHLHSEEYTVYERQAEVNQITGELSEWGNNPTASIAQVFN